MILTNLDLAIKVKKRLLEKHPGHFDVYTDKEIEKYVKYTSYLMIKIIKMKRDLIRKKNFSFFTKKTGKMNHFVSNKCDILLVKPN